MHLLHGPKVPGQQVLEVPMGAGEEPFPQADQVHLLDQGPPVVEQGEDVDVVRYLLALLRQADVGDEGGGQPLEADGGAIKSHYLDTAGRAGILRELYPELTIVGGIVLNRSVGEINPAAAERSAQAGGRMLWFPTMDALSYQRYHHRNDPGEDLSSYLTVLDENDRLLPEVLDVLDVAAAYHLATGTGHLGAHEGMILVQEGLRRGCRMVLTHCDNPANFYTVEQQVEAVRWGAMIEHSYLTTLWGRTPIEEIARMIRATGCENVFLTTDYGQPKSPYTDEGMLQYAQDLLGQGFTEEDLDRMMRRNPARLIAPEA